MRLGFFTIFLLLAGAAGYLFYQGIRNRQFRYVDTLTFEQAIRYFKDPERLQLLRENPHNAACVLKSQEADFIQIVFAIFDTVTSDLACVELYNAKNLDESFLKHFAGKDLLVLR